MPSPTSPETLKAALRDRMLSLEQAELAAATAHYQAYLEEAMLDDRDNWDMDEIALATAAASLATSFDHPVHTHEAKLTALQGLDFSPTDVVRPGAVVRFNNRNFIVSVSTFRFQHAGETYMGISQQSPIYAAIAGLKAGDSFEHDGRQITLQSVF